MEIKIFFMLFVMGMTNQKITNAAIKNNSTSTAEMLEFGRPLEILLRREKRAFYPYYGKFASSMGINSKSKRSQLLTPNQLISMLSTSNQILEGKNPGVNCMPMGMCSCAYGTVEAHFENFGFVNPSDVECLNRNGLMLCIDPSYSCLFDDVATTTTTTTITPTTTTPTPTTSQPEIPTTQCSQTKEGKFGTFPNPNDLTCQSYIQCNFGSPVIMQCPGRLVFDPVRKVCVWNYQYRCPTMKNNRRFNGNGNEYKDHQYNNDIM